MPERKKMQEGFDEDDLLDSHFIMNLLNIRHSCGAKETSIVF